MKMALWLPKKLNACMLNRLLVWGDGKSFTVLSNGQLKGKKDVMHITEPRQSITNIIMLITIIQNIGISSFAAEVKLGPILPFFPI